MFRSQPVSVYAPQINRMNTRYMLLSGAPPFVTLHRCIAEFQADVSPTFKHREEAAETAADDLIYEMECLDKIAALHMDFKELLFIWSWTTYNQLILSKISVLFSVISFRHDVRENHPQVTI